MYRLISRPIAVICLVLSWLVILELFAVGGLTWRNSERIDRLKQDIEHGNHLQYLIFQLLKVQTQPNSPTSEVKGLNNLHRLTAHFLENQLPATQNTRKALEEIQSLLFSIDQGDHKNIEKMLTLTHEVLLQQISEEEALLEEIHRNSQLELKLAIFIPSTVIFILLCFGYFFMKHHVFKPVEALEDLLFNLIEGKKKPINDISNNSIMQPVFVNYNQLVTRLSELELEQQNRTISLQQEVYNATHTLLEQSHSLARAERLAAIGELAASAAHELRNPLAGIQAALENLCQDCNDEDMGNRLNMVGDETKRLTSRLNKLLAYSRQAPEKSKHFDLYHVIEELFTLLRYQINESISLHYKLSRDTTVFLPENELRQALLNLLLNAIQAIGSNTGAVYLSALQQTSELVISINDTGSGFPRELLEQGIKPFASYKEQGTGLGLPMVQRFAKSQGGLLILSNNRQGHACVSLTLPNST